jgi:hypothetical protein
VTEYRHGARQRQPITGAPGPDDRHPDLRDRDVVLKPLLSQVAECPAAIAEEERYLRRSARSSAGLGLKRTTVGQCGGCRKPITRTNEHCGCGFSNDLRGNLNHGAYRDGASGDAIPF